MIPKLQVDRIKDDLLILAEFKSKDLITRKEWGAYDFSKVEADINSIFQVLRDLDSSPLKYLSRDDAMQISSGISNALEVLNRIDSFRIDTVERPNRVRDEICEQLTKTSENLLSLVTPLQPYLALKGGVISQNIEDIYRLTNEAKKVLDDSKKRAKENQQNINEITKIARQTAGSAGVSIFTPEFDKEASILSRRSKLWLIATATLAVFTIFAAVIFYSWPEASSDATGWQATLQNVVSKSAVIAVLFTGAIWCGRIYRALIHQATVNRHRALSLKTFNAFVEGSKDQQVRDAVLIAATNTVFSNVPTGFVESKSDQSGRVNLEISKLPKSNLVDE